ncbi:1-(5-phosphoribosyl)-5-[(5-phosphoribosylamino)methylideneamino]imidazole-4-carboxamide isomerase [Salinibacillus xinjiangensis]|uniref:1-(5-phosphoribosyl)-5-[(5-phosphoribosylamino)methylideneamino] imidazole-4-carboxamide isomerase n=1 Tax=Salinibacillus xinjiangensis TaxID=1229268 RepID=A0A6G1X8I9_9BACI|nr:1-(5-phosphoribosyl)-5-[(5-phosphoribosylamino)methylideneamino]imidazole-4-carboxamide isomerase [Salinibacillus xinjiangensis]MRG87249.1 1-(5-phosphoribosyl)-5-[(5-phosphoribosylamino)methylideneamino]imidazole-4-carboxamide isomerase [Salinibacillus xinjiangensis]
MILYPAIDIRNGKCVRLIQGDYNKEDVYGDPVEMALRWIDKGAEALHLVDLDGALSGTSENLTTIESIVEKTDVPIQVGGGIRTMNQVDALAFIGVSRIILGTAALHDEQFLTEAVKKYPKEIAVSIDAKRGYVATDGWTKTSERKALDFAKELEDKGVQTIIYTDIAKDGMLSGPNLEEIQTVNKNVGLNVIASGGVSTPEDVRTLSKLDVHGAIIGKALYTGKIDLEEILREV